MGALPQWEGPFPRAQKKTGQVFTAELESIPPLTVVGFGFLICPQEVLAALLPTEHGGAR